MARIPPGSSVSPSQGILLASVVNSGVVLAVLHTRHVWRGMVPFTQDFATASLQKPAKHAAVVSRPSQLFPHGAAIALDRLLFALPALP